MICKTFFRLLPAIIQTGCNTKKICYIFIFGCWMIQAKFSEKQKTFAIKCSDNQN